MKSLFLIISLASLLSCSNSEPTKIPDSKYASKNVIKVDAISLGAEVVHDNTLNLKEIQDLLGEYPDLKIEIDESPRFGKLTIENGVVHYTPYLGYIGQDSFRYHLVHLDEDVELEGVLEGEISLNIINLAPKANSTEVYASSGRPNIYKFPLNDESDPNSLLLTTITSYPTNGVVEVLTPETFRYLPNPGFTGYDAITYLVSDGKDSSSGEISIRVIGPSPDGSYDFFETGAGESVEIELGAQIGNKVSIDVVSAPPVGDLIDQKQEEGKSLGDYRYTPLGRYLGIDQFSYRVTDNLGEESPLRLAYVSIINTGPEYRQKNLQTPSFESFNFTLDVTDKETAYEDLTFYIDKAPKNGILTKNNSGVFTYIPNDSFSGYDFFDFSVSDGGWRTDSYTVPILVQNRAPVAQELSFSISSNAVLNENALCSDPEGKELSYEFVSDVTRGEIEFFENLESGAFRFEPLVNDSGPIQVQYRCFDGELYSANATILINIDSIPPTVMDQDHIIPSNITGEAYKFNLSYVDPDNNPDDLKIFIIQAPTRGQLTLSRQGLGRYSYSTGIELSYMAELNTSTYEDTAVIRLFDGVNTSEEVTLRLKIENRAPISEDFDVSTQSGTSVSFRAQKSDPEGTDVFISSYRLLRNFGVVSYDSVNDLFTYSPNGPMIKTLEGDPEVLEYYIQDSDEENPKEAGPFYAKISITNQAPTLLDDRVETLGTLAIQKDFKIIDSDDDISEMNIQIIEEASNGDVQITGQSFQYRPTGIFNGEDSFKVVAIDSDGAQSPVATISVGVGNHPPVISDKLIQVMASQLTTINLKTFVTDPDGTITPSVYPLSSKGGNYVDQGNGNILFSARPGEAGRGELTVKSVDDKGSEVVKILPVEILSAINVTKDTTEVDQGGERIIYFDDMVGNDTSLLPQSSDIYFDQVVEVAGGEIEVRSDGILFTSGGLSGDEAYIKYKVKDNYGNYAYSIMNISIKPLQQLDALVYNNDPTGFNDAIGNYKPPTPLDVFNTWERFYGNSPMYLKNNAVGEAASWRYNAGGFIESTVNSENFIGFVSPTLETNYIHEADVTSSHSDDDYIGLIAAFKRIGSVNHYITIYRSVQCRTNVFIRYHQGNSVVKDFYLSRDPNCISYSWKSGGGWSSRPGKFLVQRTGDIFKFQWSRWNTLDIAYTYILNLADYPDVAKVFTGEQKYGYIANSQPNASWRNIKFSGEKTQDKIYNILADGTKQVWKYNFSTNNFELDCESIDPNECLFLSLGGGNIYAAAPRMYHNQLTRITHWIQKDGRIISDGNNPCIGIALPTGAECEAQFDGVSAKLSFSNRASPYTLLVPDHFTRAQVIANGAGGGGYFSQEVSNGGSGETVIENISGIEAKQLKIFTGMGGEPAKVCDPVCPDYTQKYTGMSSIGAPGIIAETKLNESYDAEDPDSGDEYINQEFMAAHGGGSSGVQKQDGTVLVEASGGGGGGYPYYSELGVLNILNGSRGAGGRGGYGADLLNLIHGQDLEGSALGASGLYLGEDIDNTDNPDNPIQTINYQGSYGDNGDVIMILSP